MLHSAHNDRCVAVELESPSSVASSRCRPLAASSAASFFTYLMTYYLEASRNLWSIAYFQIFSSLPWAERTFLLWAELENASCKRSGRLWDRFWSKSNLMVRGYWPFLHSRMRQS